MTLPTEQAPGGKGIVGHVARSSLTFALLDSTGAVRHDTIRTYEASAQLTVTGGLSEFLRDHEFGEGPKRCALAVAGVVRGDTISITNSQWFVSRDGVQALLRTRPVLLNDFAALAWALNGRQGISIEPVPARRPPLPRGAGTFCLIGVGMGLGVSALVNSESGSTTVLDSEGGASLPPAVPELPPALQDLLVGAGHRMQADTILSGPGLVRLAALLRGDTRLPSSIEFTEVRRTAAMRDAADREAVELFCRCLWQFAANLVLIYGAWSGVILTGPLIDLLRAAVTRSAADGFALKGPHVRLLREVPLGFAKFDHGELAGASVALGSALREEQALAQDR